MDNFITWRRLAQFVNDLQTSKLSNGTLLVQGPDFCVTTLPNGAKVHAHINLDTLAMAQELGFGNNAAALTREHDSLHSRLMDWLGQPYSYSLMRAAGYEDIDWGIASLEEEAVLAIQKLLNEIKNKS